MAGVKTAKKGKGKAPVPSLTERRCTQCSQRIMSNEIAPLLIINMEEKTRRMVFSHKKGCPQ
jgi:hypothetical protein